MVDPTSETLGRNLYRIRTSKKLSIEKLSSLMEANGHRLGWSMLSRTERGLRKATVGDLMALACSLEVSPLELLLHPHDEELADVSGFGVVPAAAVRDWVMVGGPLEDYLDSHQEIYT